MQVEYARLLGNIAHSIPTIGNLMTQPRSNQHGTAKSNEGQVYKWCRATTGCDGSTNEGKLAPTCWWLRASQLTMAIARRMA